MMARIDPTALRNYFEQQVSYKGSLDEPMRELETTGTAVLTLDTNDAGSALSIKQRIAHIFDGDFKFRVYEVEDEFSLVIEAELSDWQKEVYDILVAGGVDSLIATEMAVRLERLGRYEIVLVDSLEQPIPKESVSGIRRGLSRRFAGSIVTTERFGTKVKLVVARS